MADTKISALPASTTPLAGTEVLPIVQSGTTKQVSVADLTTGRAISVSGLTVTGGTANCIPYLNGSKVLTCDANLKYDGGGNVFNSTAGGGYYLNAYGAYSNGMLLNGTSLAFRVGGVQQFLIDTSGNFRVTPANGEIARFTTTGLGLNNTNPSYLLDVAGESRVTGSKKVTYFAGMPPNYPNNTMERAVTCDIAFGPSAGGTDVKINQTKVAAGHWRAMVQMSADANGTGVGLVTMILDFDTYADAGGSLVVLNPKLTRYYSQNGTYYAWSTAPNIAITKSGTYDIILTIAGNSSYSTGLCRVEFYGSSTNYNNSITLSLPGTSTSSSWLTVNGWDQTNSTNTTPTNVNVLYSNGNVVMTADANGNLYGTTGTTGMTDGFFYIPGAAGAPSGTATAVSGRVPMYYDTTNNKFYVYNGGWKGVTLS